MRPPGVEAEKSDQMQTMKHQLVLSDLLQRAGSLKSESDWQPFRPGIDIRRLYQTPDNGPAAALLRYQPGASVPRHEHLCYEHILILDGAQVDDSGACDAGTFIINPPASSHRVASPEGCVVLIIWERGVRFETEA
jgi:anti-sigma factor ChrR (cupin superfamily)